MHPADRPWVGNLVFLSWDSFLKRSSSRRLAVMASMIVLVVSGGGLLVFMQGSRALRQQGEERLDSTLFSASRATEGRLLHWVEDLEVWSRHLGATRRLTDTPEEATHVEALDVLRGIGKDRTGLVALRYHDDRGELTVDLRGTRALGEPQPLVLQFGERAELRVVADWVVLRVPSLDGDSGKSSGALEVVIDARSLIPEGVETWASIVDENENVLAGGGRSDWDTEPLGSDYVARESNLRLPRIGGDGLRLRIVEEQRELFGEIPMLRFLVTILAVGSSLILIGLITIYGRYHEEMVRAIRERAAELEAANGELRLSQAALEQETVRADLANRAKSHFLANMSHEIRTPMNGVLGMVSLLHETELDDEQSELVDTIQSSGEDIATVINDILDFSKLDSGHTDLEQVPFDIWRICEDVVEAYAERALEKGVRVRFITSSSVPRKIVGDPNRVRQIVMNLMDNAFKFTDRGDIRLELRISSADRSSHRSTSDRSTLCFSVNDTGRGIPRHALDNIFESFTLAEFSTTREIGGTGLGLAICKRLIELMGGEIHVDSELGKGSEFRFTMQARVPLENDGENPQLKGSAWMLVSRGSTEETLRDHLEHVGYEVRHCGRGSELADCVETRPCDLVIVEDDRLSENPGETLRALRQRGHEGVVLYLHGAQNGLESSLAEQSSVWSLKRPLRSSELSDLARKALQQVGHKACAPLLAGTSNEERSMEDAPRPTCFDGVTVLLAEDIRVNQRIVEKMLNRLGCSVDIANNGLEAVEQFRKSRYDLILMDCEMPLMDGYEATRNIREVEKGRGTEESCVIVAYTANVLESDRQSCFEAGMDDFLSKPINLADLRGAVERWAPAQERAS